LSKREYFAKESSDKLASLMGEKLTEYRQYLGQSGLKAKWRKAYRLYYGRHFAKNSPISGLDSDILRLGDRGEIAAFAANHFRNLIKHVLAMTTSQKVVYDCKAVNSDSKSILQAKLGNQILDAYMQQMRLGRHMKTAAEHAQVFGKGFVVPSWDTMAGQPYSRTVVMDDLGQPKIDDDGNIMEKVVYEGDIDMFTPSAFDVYVDPALDDFNALEWYNVRRPRNKFNLAEQYPQLRDEILDFEDAESAEQYIGMTGANFNESSLVWLNYFYHKRTPAMPNGRLVIFLSDDIVLYDGPMPYDNLNLFRIVPGDIFGTTEGYSDAFDVIPINEAINVLLSTIFTNQQAHGIQKVWVREGSNLTAQQISKALAVLKSPEKPEAINLTATPKEVFDNVALLTRLAETMMGVNSVVRGDPDSSLKSGVALGLVQSMAVQYSSQFQASWAQIHEDVGTFLISILKQFAKTERLIAMAGKRNRSYMSAFSGKDLANINRVSVDLGNPVSRTLAGKMQMAEDLLGKGMIKTPQEYMTVLESGNLEPLTEGQDAENTLIRQENEALMDGKPVRAIPGDQHLLHSQEHKALLADPAIRINGQHVEKVLSHIQEHVQLYKTQDPVFAMISGEPPAPMPPPMAPPPGAPTGPQPQGPGEGGAPMPMSSGPAPLQAPFNPEVPGLPENLQPPVAGAI
jgi:hypothetical protein